MQLIAIQTAAMIILASCGVPSNSQSTRTTTNGIGQAEAENNQESSDAPLVTGEQNNSYDLNGKDVVLGEIDRPGFVNFAVGPESWDGRFFISLSDVAAKVQVLNPNLTPLNFTDQKGIRTWRSASSIGTISELEFTWPNLSTTHSPGDRVWPAIGPDKDPALGFYTAHSAIARNPRAKTPHGNPYRCNYDPKNGRFPTDLAPNGKHLCYEALVFTSVYYKKDFDGKFMATIPAKIVIEFFDGKTPAKPVFAKMTSWFRPMQYRDSSGNLKKIEKWEPSATADGRLLMTQNQFTYNFDPDFSQDKWSQPQNIGLMNSVEAEFEPEALTFKQKYPLAAKPMLDAFGNRCYVLDEFGKEIRTCGGAYPWISKDGTELIYAGVPIVVPKGESEVCKTKNANGNFPANLFSAKAGASIIGVRTGYVEKHIDTLLNRNRLTFVNQTRVLGLFGTMWTPFPELGQWALPYTRSQPSYGVIGASTYSEVTFDDAMDGNYLVYLSMNELRGRSQQISDDQHNYVLNSASSYSEADLNCAKEQGFFAGLSTEAKRAYIAAPNATAASPYATTISQRLTPDTSGNFHNAELRDGAFFPQEYFILDPEIDRGGKFGESIGYQGRAVIMAARGSVRIYTSPRDLSITVGGKAEKIAFNKNAKFNALTQDRSTATIDLA